ncbi:Grx4 family monothiol glutaredoxin [Phenylobacterium immobile]|uniref:Grx4 family monothiol glutaredoxin n=1 Tax=Phenylobacterium immobile TaxID=21 RepID=UPI000B29558A|nr:Grx4 family monothiol glutaredoxin [Phenylobacterium immobile]
MSDAATTTTDPVHGFIAKTLGEYPVVLFMKGSPDAPKCGFSSQVVQILDQLGAEYVGVDVLQSQPLRDGIKTYSDWPTIPQLYVKGEFVGGCDIIKEMYETGELESFLDEQGVIPEAS